MPASVQAPAAIVTTTTTAVPPQQPSIVLTDKDDSNGAYKGLPRWARLVGTLGLPSVLVFWLLWSILGGNAKTIAAMSQQLNLHTVQMESHGADFREFMRMHTAEEEQFKAILMQICANGARSAAERSGCFPTVVIKAP